MRLVWICTLSLIFHLTVNAQVESSAIALNDHFEENSRPASILESQFIPAERVDNGLKNQFFFIKKEAIKGIYYDEAGRSILEWMKAKDVLSGGQSTVKFTIYEGDSVEVNISLYNKIKDNLDVICSTDDLGFNGTYQTLATQGNQVFAFQGFVKITGPQRKFAMNEIPLIDVDFFMERADTLTYHYVHAKNTETPLTVANNATIYTNQRVGTKYEDGYFQRQYNSDGFGHETNVSISQETDKTVLLSDKKFFSIEKTIASGTQQIRQLLIQDTFDSQNRIVERVGPGITQRYHYIGPLTEVREVYSIDKKGREKLKERVEVRNTYYK